MRQKREVAARTPLVSSCMESSVGSSVSSVWVIKRLLYHMSVRVSCEDDPVAAGPHALQRRRTRRIQRMTKMEKELETMSDEKELI